MGPDYCGSCHGLKIEDQSGKSICCNSCSAVFAAHEHMGVEPPRIEDIEQCRLENWPDLIKNHSQEGCRMNGNFKVNKVTGNFHFAAGHSLDIKGQHLHDIRFLDGLHLDFGHHIHQLSFGDRHAHIKNPLDDVKVLPSSTISGTNSILLLYLLSYSQMLRKYIHTMLKWWLLISIIETVTR